MTSAMGLKTTNNEGQETILLSRLKKYAPKVGGLMIATAVLAQQVIIETKGNPERRVLKKGDTSLQVPSTDMEKSAPQIIADNQQIFEFLDGDINETDDYMALYTKVQNKFKSLNTFEDDVFTKNLRLEISYRKEKKLPHSQLLEDALKQAEYKKQALVKLISELESLPKTQSGVSAMNELIIKYYNLMEGESSEENNSKIWNKEQLNEWGTRIEEERNNLHYRADIIRFLQQEGDDRKSQQHEQALSCKKPPVRT